MATNFSPSSGHVLNKFPSISQWSDTGPSWPSCSTLLLNALCSRVDKSCNCLVNPFPNKPWFLCVCCESFENTAGNGEIARNEQFLLFPQCFLPVWRTFCHLHQIQNCRLQTLTVWKSQNLVVWQRVKSSTLYSMNTHFDASTTDSFWKRCGKKKKLHPICPYFWHQVFICCWIGRAENWHMK